MKKNIFIIEHLENRLWKWCLSEYKNISKIVGKSNLRFSNVKRGNKMLEKYGKVFKESVKEMNLKNTCILDPDSNMILKSKEARKFNFFIFGRILGNYPPRKRTKKVLSRFIPHVKIRNIGKKQMATDNAVYVVNKIINGKEINELKFKDKIEIEINEIESVILPYRYVLLYGKPLISKEIIYYLKRKKGF